MSYRLFLIREKQKFLSMVLNRESQRVASLRFSEPLTKKAYLHNIEVHPNFRNGKYGTYLIKNFHYYLKEHTDVNKVSGVLWDDTTNPYLQHFFTKNGYKLDHDSLHYYDDGDIINEITPFERDI